MAYAAQNTAAHLSIFARLGEIRDQAVAAYRARKAYRTTLNELSALNAHELDDLGLSRTELSNVAFEATYGYRA